MKRYRAHGVGRRGGREPRHVSRADRIGRTCNTGRYAGSIAGGRRQPGAVYLSRRLAWTDEDVFLIAL
ncbi:MAG TPA: hypothetical protein VKT27_08230 [Candidatus Binataceae bacterium]|nr:hypothetical protein [Candidatus Binataceae bacterium]